MSKPIALAEFVSKEYGLEWDWDSILELFEQYIDNQLDEGALRDFLVTAAQRELEKNGARMTGKQIRQFVAKGELICPYCKYDDPEGGSFETQDNGVRQEMVCPNCRRTWTFLYEIVWVIEDGEEEKNG